MANQTLTIKEMAGRATEALHQLRRDESANGNHLVCDAIDQYLETADTSSKARLYSLVRNARPLI